MNREYLYAALWQQLCAIPGFKTYSRKLRHWNDVDPLMQPAMFLAQGNETPMTVTGQPGKWLLQSKIYLYARTEGDAPPGPVLNPLLDAICNVVSAQNPVTGRSVLADEGIEWCRIEAAIETDEGTLGDQAVAVIPVTILAT